jgi:hypothetical protein
MKTLFTIILCLTILTGFSQRVANPKVYPPNGPGNPGTVSLTGLGNGITANDLVTSLIGAGVSFSNVSFTGTQGGDATASGGKFTNGLACIGIDQGVILCCGHIINAPGVNSGDGTGSDIGLGGDADLNAAFGGIVTFDATVLEFDFIPTADHIFVQYVFGSDEYNEFVGQFNDPFAFFLDGTNIALVPGSGNPVSVGTINLGSNPAFYKDNDFGDFGGNPPFDIEADGFTTVLTAQSALTPNVTHHIKLVIADRNDHVLDSWVFLKGSSFSTQNPEAIPTLSQWGLIILGLALLGLGTVYILRRRGLVA